MGEAVGLTGSEKKEKDRGHSRARISHGSEGGRHHRAVSQRYGIPRQTSLFTLEVLVPNEHAKLTVETKHQTLAEKVEEEEGTAPIAIGDPKDKIAAKIARFVATYTWRFEPNLWD